MANVDQPYAGHPQPGIRDAMNAVFREAADLIHKEVDLLKAELAENVGAKLRGSLWAGAAGITGFLSVVLLLEGLVFVLASFGMPLHWACFLVAVLMGGVAAILYGKARAAAERKFTPTTSLHNIQDDLKAVKEQLT